MSNSPDAANPLGSLIPGSDRCTNEIDLETCLPFTNASQAFILLQLHFVSFPLILENFQCAGRLICVLHMAFLELLAFRHLFYMLMLALVNSVEALPQQKSSKGTKASSAASKGASSKRGATGGNGARNGAASSGVVSAATDGSTILDKTVQIKYTLPCALNFQH